MHKITNFKRFLQGGFAIKLLLRSCSEECRQLIREDIEAYSRKAKELIPVMDLLFDDTKKPFRNVLYYRFQSDCCSERLLRISKFFIKPVETIEIGGQIDGGLKIIHRYCVISVLHAGKNLTVMQGVTIGKDLHNGHPSLGDNVIIFPNAVIFGDIQIGDNVKIGALSVINKNVPSFSTAVGNPFRVL